MFDGYGRGNGKASARLLRLLAKLQEYNFTITHIAGRDNIRADFLSRLPTECSDPLKEDDTECVVSNVNDLQIQLNSDFEKEWASAMENDPVMAKVKLYLSSAWPPIRNLSSELKTLVHVANELSMINGVLRRGDLLVPPSKLRKHLIRVAHATHLGSTMTKKDSKNTIGGLGWTLM